ncbi:ATP-binding cassette domain-containing protein [Paenibacillus eucommiae]|uniref:ABC-type multidrug transport system ATPase subunit n=1 Tax=Paenibacillus eucommiae TaxID=1355755 RepID=A0ABS4J919_9BACL|nr:ABC transporter ATP-binding protein [Paenibacillus eucommiae]MBP1996335.1 ABC-type multidrug transport system ATPase subunit [Paenibacillus eucommiae]
MRVTLDGVKARTAAGRGMLGREFGPMDIKLFPGLTGLIGPNGSGKSVLIQMLSQVWQPSSGEIRYEIHGIPLSSFEARQHTGYVPQQISIYEHLSVRDYLKYIADLKCLDNDAISAVLQQMGDVFHIKAIVDEKLGQLSVGQQRLAMVAQALLGAPAFLFLDEPFENLDIRQRRRLLEMLVDVARGSIVLVSNHITEEMDKGYDRIIKLRNS